MRTNHTHHTLAAFPVFSAAFIADDRLVLGGGGGSSRSGVKNKLRLYDVPNDKKLELRTELELEKDEDAPMSMAADAESNRVICGINSSTDDINNGINKNCRMFGVSDDGLKLLGTAGTLELTADTLDDCQKVTVLSPGRTLAAAAGLRKLSVLSYPSLAEAAQSVTTEHDIYDATLSLTALVVATTNNLFVYSTPAANALDHKSSPGPQTRSKRKTRQQTKTTNNVPPLTLIKKLDRPALPGIDGEASAFRACRFNPTTEGVLYTVSNTVPARMKGNKGKTKQGFVCRWNTATWEVVKIRQEGRKGITCFDVSPNGKFVAFGSADCTIGILDAHTLAPLLHILKAHDFPPTVIRFNPSSSLLISGSADNSVEVISVPEGLAGTKWTTGQIVILIFLVLVLPILFAMFVYGSK